MVYRAVAGDAAGMLGVRLTREASLSGLCVESEETLRCDDSDVDPRVDREACRRVGLRSIVVVPLIHEGGAVGVLKVFSPEVAAFDAGDSRVLELMSELIAAAMFHATRYGVDELFRQATTDQLTGLANRALFMDRLRHAIASSYRTQRRLAVLMLDMDGLKPINDTFGHRAGDAALQELARRIAAELRQSDTVARFGGNDFAYLLSTVPDRESAQVVAQRIARRCDRPFDFEGQTLHDWRERRRRNRARRRRRAGGAAEAGRSRHVGGEAAEEARDQRLSERHSLHTKFPASSLLPMPE